MQILRVLLAPRATWTLLAVVLALGLSACSKIPSEALCQRACQKYVDISGDAKRQALAKIPKEYRDRYDVKLGTDGAKLVETCVEHCKVDGSIAAAECLAEAKTQDDLAACRRSYGTAP